MSEAPSSASSARLEAAVAEFLEALERGQPPDRTALLASYADVAGELAEFLADHDRMNAWAAPLVQPPKEATPTPRGSTELTISADGTLQDSRPGAVPTATVAAPWRIGPYEILHELGRGGMGVVYQARHVGLNRVVALKTILAARCASPSDLARFRGEALAAARLTHSGLVPIFEVGEEGGQPYFSMPLISGQNLAERLKHGPLAPQVAARLLRKIVAAVAYAHAQGVIHRDLKPANILLTAGDSSTVDAPLPATCDALEPKITDFGLAKRLDTADHLTSTGQILGTPGYMPPEQAAGRLKDIGPTADIYSLGTILYAMLTGRPPFQSDNPVETLLQVLEREPPLPSKLVPGVPRELEWICLKCLEKSPADRYPTAAELGDDLDRFLRREPLAARRPTIAQRLRRWVRRQPVLAGHLIALGALLVLTQAIYLVKRHDDLLYHFSVSGALAVWMLICLGFQWLSERERHWPWTHYLWSATDAFLLTGVLSLLAGPLGPLLAGYLVLVCAAGLYFQTRLVAFNTAALLVAFGLLLILRPEVAQPGHYAFLFAATLAIAGFLVGYQVWRMSVLREYYGDRPLP
jgi:eukaryotic-like serine/threonine-protein kinase